MDTTETHHHVFRFHGTAGEYFGIWIVNILLTILTLGIYSAWAKVRKERYFYGSAELDGERFTYLAQPMQILIGRLIVVGILVAINLLVTFIPFLAILLVFLFIFIFPELLRRGLRFNARVSAYRNVRFDFVGTYGEAFKATILGPIISLFSLGLAYPVAERWTREFVIGNVRYGGRRFAMNAPLGEFYRVFWQTLAIAALGVIILLIQAAFGGTAVQFGTLSVVPSIFTLLVAYVLIGSAALLFSAGIRNVTFNSTVIDGRHYLRSNVDRWGYVWLMISNFLVTLLTVGLMWPWAAVRHARFLADATALEAHGDLASYTDTIRESTSAVSAEYMDIEGVDFGL